MNIKKLKHFFLKKIKTFVTLPHFLPIGLFLMLHLLGIITAIAGLAPAFLAIGDNIAAHKTLW